MNVCACVCLHACVCVCLIFKSCWVCDIEEKNSMCYVGENTRNFQSSVSILMILLLLWYFDDWHVSQQYGTTALMVASYSGHYECVKELIMQGADINYQREVKTEFCLGLFCDSCVSFMLNTDVCSVLVYLSTLIPPWPRKNVPFLYRSLMYRYMIFVPDPQSPVAWPWSFGAGPQGKINNMFFAFYWFLLR